jgi:hypothetical protein
VGLPGTEGYIVEFGIPWTAYEFSDKALDLIHPFEAVRSIQSPANLRSIFNILTLGPTAIKIKRMKLVADLGKMAVELRGAEMIMKKSMDAGVRRIMNGKRILVLKALLNEIGYKDATLINDLIIGMKIVGELPASHEFPARPPPLQGT